MYDRSCWKTMSENTKEFVTLCQLHKKYHEIGSLFANHKTLYRYLFFFEKKGLTIYRYIVT